MLFAKLTNAIPTLPYFLSIKTVETAT